MSYKVLARKWRPKKFEEVVGQEHITRTLKNAMSKDKVAHAYLFTGTRGVGKTTVARIFGKALMCQNKDENFNPCLKCNSCVSVDRSNSIDFIEIDGASNNSVENIRELIDNVQYLPTSGRYKVYVIDEVHMLSTSAFNALLKTLEEPPAHVVFIFATTDPQKLLGTVLSRCQRFDFKSVSIELLQSHIQNIANTEEFNFASSKELREICKYGKGSVRDTLSLLDQVLSLCEDDVITQESLNLSLGLANTELVTNLINNVLGGNSKSVVASYKEIVKENVDFKKFASQVLEILFEIIENIDGDNISGDLAINHEILAQLSFAEIFWIYEALAKDFDWAITSFDPETNLELSLMKVCLRRQLFNEQPVNLSVTEVKKKIFNPQLVEEERLILNTEKPEIEKNWQTFTEYLFEVKKTLAVNVERGNLLSEVDFNSKQLSINLGFSQENQIFYDFVQEKQAKDLLHTHVCQYFSKKEEDVLIIVSLLTDEEKLEKNFLSKVEVDEQNFAAKKEEQRQKILNNSFIKQAEKLFNTKINKIILNENYLGE